MFNLHKHNQIPTTPIGPGIADGFSDIEDQFEDPTQIKQTSDELIDTVEDPDQEMNLQQAQNVHVWEYFQQLQYEYPDLATDINTVKTTAQIQDLNDDMQPNAIAALKDSLADENDEAMAQLMGGTYDIQITKEKILQAAENAQRTRLQNPQNAPGFQMAADSKKNTKKAQTMQMPMQETSRFPVTGEEDFINKFLNDLLGFNSSETETNQYQLAKRAAEEISRQVSESEKADTDSALEAIMQIDANDLQGVEKSKEWLGFIYKYYLPSTVKLIGDATQQGLEPVMSDKKTNDTPNIKKEGRKNTSLNHMIKTAADQFGQPYLLYGPTEKRICPKLRGKNLSVGDVVSEYTCRHHCPAGIVIDDNKTICGEALWRANVMDKQTREYVDADGNLTGGYLNKRFETQRIVAEENKMRLKPGELRKPLPPSARGMESRLQDMRNKEGEKRGYRPNVNTGQPFNWAKDVDQNNVQVSQAERDRREEASGHQLVQYTNRDEGENNPKKASGPKNHKLGYGGNLDAKCSSCGSHLVDAGDGAGHCPRCDELVQASPEKGFNLKLHKTAQMTGMRGPVSPENPSSAGLGLSPDVAKPIMTPDGGRNDVDDSENDLWGNPDEPGEEDITAPDPGGPFYYSGKEVARNEQELVAWMEQENYYPDVWFISDHGNPHLITQIVLDRGKSEPEPMMAPMAKPMAPPVTEPMMTPMAGFNLKQHKTAKSPPGFEHTVEHMKEKHPELSEGKEKNPFALAHWMKNKGYESHKDPKNVHECGDDKDMKSVEASSKKKS